MPPGSLMKAVIRSGVDSKKPAEGDQVCVGHPSHIGFKSESFMS